MTSLIGANVARSDAESKVRGEAVYGVDYGSLGMLHAKLLRSPTPAGSIRTLDVSATKPWQFNDFSTRFLPRLPQ